MWNRPPTVRWALLLLWTCLAMPLARADEDAGRSAAIYSELAKAFGNLLRLKQVSLSCRSIAFVAIRGLLVGSGTLEFEGDGKLDRTAFSQLIFDMGVSVTRSDLDDIFDEIDSPDGEGHGNDDGGVSPSELGAWWAEVSRCDRRTSCGSCALAKKCAWCLSSGVCVNDEPGLCAGPEDHVGMAGTASGCPANAADMIQIASAGMCWIRSTLLLCNSTGWHYLHVFAAFSQAHRSTQRMMTGEKERCRRKTFSRGLGRSRRQTKARSRLIKICEATRVHFSMSGCRPACLVIS